MTKDEIEKLLKNQFDDLPPMLQKAGRYVLQSPTSVAMDSMRSTAAAANVQPPVMLRLARQLGFENYETFRDCYRGWVSNPAESLYKRAEALTRRGSKQEQRQQLLEEILRTSVQNLGTALGESNANGLEQAKNILMGARRNYVFGVRSLFPAAYYLHYACSTLYDNFVLLTGLGATIVDELRRINKHDAITIFTFYPYSAITAQIAEFASERKASIIVVSDSIVSPAARKATVNIVMPNASPSMFPSILPAMATAEALAALLVASQKEAGLKEIKDLRAQLTRFKIFSNS